ncbi:hypothetical protein [Pedobacter sp. SL55]|uniref:hypothetical protein n=1 Tax=Pedobacter sp. SL55 TaxID=2995161 RepID=UPI00226E1B1B|nr:hypothetical protein [Pedobacter sp. SL55]WAC41172.1 hypothetical protein OVA16_02010 [Pedobacter sp. SL55]
MHPILRNILAIIAGIVFGSLVNGAIIMVSGNIIAPPAGVDLTTEEGLNAGMYLMEPKHFILPFLAHAIGTFVGAYIAARIATKKIAFAMVIGSVFLTGGIWMVMIVPSPIWFTIVDLAGAYLPVAYFAGRIAK